MKQVVVSRKKLQGRKDDKKFADQFNSFFQIVGPKLAWEIFKYDSRDANIQTSMNEQVSSSLFFNPVADEDITKTIKYLNKISAPGPDRLDSEFFKHNSSTLSKHLVHLINLTFSEGIFPKI